MRLQHFVVGAALCVVLAGPVPASAGAGGQTGPQVKGIGAHQQNGSKSAAPEHGQVLDLRDLRDRFEVGAPGRRPDERRRLQLAIEKLRRLVHVAVQKAVCHPRPKPPHGHGSAGYTLVGFGPGSGFRSDDDRWDDDPGRRDHDHDNDHGDHGHDHGDRDHDHGDHGHKPPFCPSPH